MKQQRNVIIERCALLLLPVQLEGPISVRLLTAQNCCHLKRTQIAHRTVISARRSSVPVV